MVNKEESESFRKIESDAEKLDAWKVSNPKIVENVKNFLEKSQLAYDKIFHSEKSIEDEIKKHERKTEIKEAGKSSFMINIAWTGLLYGIYLSPFWLTGLYKMGNIGK